MFGTLTRLTRSKDINKNKLKEFIYKKSLCVIYT